ncbi:hypothetical protein [Halorientalis sp.]|jgi:hypothetical protein|uniref:hypothetical protein n=1 Tax=Halorientalis sp. TaxID=1931229 RepID=UPI002618AD68|nr:hypothetical protein [Halorientalis sp.]
MATTEFASHEWWESYRETVNEDQEMKVRGHDNFDENFYVEIGNSMFLIEMDGGEVENVVPEPGVNDVWSFGVEGSREAWEEFVQEYPPAHNNEIIASDYRTAVKGEDGHLELKGNNKKIWQNFRPFQRALDLMRETQQS